VADSGRIFDKITHPFDHRISALFITLVSVFNIFFVIGIVGGGTQLGRLGTAATNGLLYQPRVIMMMEKLVEWLAGETDVLRENLPQYRFIHHKPQILPGREPGPPRWEANV
jgi:hypothetical protein